MKKRDNNDASERRGVDVKMLPASLDAFRWVSCWMLGLAVARTMLMCQEILSTAIEDPAKHGRVAAYDLAHDRRPTARHCRATHTSVT